MITVVKNVCFFNFMLKGRKRSTSKFKEVSSLVTRHRLAVDTDGVYARTFSVQKESIGIYDHSLNQCLENIFALALDTLCLFYTLQ